MNWTRSSRTHLPVCRGRRAFCKGLPVAAGGSCESISPSPALRGQSRQAIQHSSVLEPRGIRWRRAESFSRVRSNLLFVAPVLSLSPAVQRIKELWKKNSSRSLRLLDSARTLSSTQGTGRARRSSFCGSSRRYLSGISVEVGQAAAIPRKTSTSAFTIAKWRLRKFHERLNP
jgi:hypothetical protein